MSGRARIQAPSPSEFGLDSSCVPKAVGPRLKPAAWCCLLDSGCGEQTFSNIVAAPESIRDH